MTGSTHNCVVSIFKSDHGWPERLEKGSDQPQNKIGEAENTKIKISYQHTQQKLESYANDESIRGKKGNNLTVHATFHTI